MNPSQLFVILRARKMVFIWTLLGTLTATLMASALVPTTYTATTTLVVDSKGVDSLTGVALPAQLLPGYIATQVDILGSRSVALRVVDAMHLAESRQYKERFLEATGGKGDIRQWIAESLQKKLKISPSRESSVVDVSFKASDPRFAADGANAFAAAYQNTTADLRAAPMKNASSYFNDQIKSLRNTMEAAQKKLSHYQQEKGIVNADSRADVETMRLNDLSAQLVNAQGQLMDAESRRHQARTGNGNESPDVVANPLIQSLKASLAQARVNFTNVAAAFTPDHPRYQRAKAEVDKLRSELNSNLRTTSNSIAGNAEIFKTREKDIKTALEAQKVKVMALNRARDELAMLTKEAETAEQAYVAATQRFNQTSIQGQAHQPDVAVLNPANVPVRPSSLKLWLNLALALVLGTSLGAGLALLFEMLDRRVRSARDVENALQVPVLGIVPMELPGRPGNFKWLPKQRLLPM
ncbi:MAG: chain length determinant family protein [Herminiimonas sp.]|nr:chain length determinant family protein [Herminiimonas sp.]MDB5852724.1 chain length determinant family protein [Herminiimonas sp.]